VTRTINLDQRRIEAGNEPVEVVVGGRSYTFAATLPITMALKAQAMVSDDVPWSEQQAVFLELCAAMVGDNDAQAFIAAINLDELLLLMSEVYGADLGELSGSVGSSSNGGNGSKQT
jgi:hypothetical protein